MVFSLKDRASGVLLHMSSLPGPHHNGDMGPAAYSFIDFLVKAKQKWWQMLPVNPIGPGNSPYSTISSFAGESLYISLDLLVKDGWLKKSELTAPKDNSAKSVNFTKARSHRDALLDIAIARAKTTLPIEVPFKEFLKNQRYWLQDYLMFKVICDHYGTAAWQRWPTELRDRDPAALKHLAQIKADEMLCYAIEQFWFYNQWSELKAYANKYGIGLIGDLPIFVSDTSADVWSHRKFFQLDASYFPTVVAGCPPDSFNKDGQLWGNALYDWSALKKDGFSWWIHRLGSGLKLFDAVRLDHFIGFHRYWEIKAGAKTAKDGRWMKVPGDEFFNAVTKAFKKPQFIAEDLGAVTPEVRALRDKYEFPGMKVSQFAFDGSEEATHHVPHGVPKNSVAYTGTHDNNTTRGWFQDIVKRASAGSKSAKAELNRIECYLDAKPATISWDMIRATMSSQASLTVFPVQDLLSQAAKDRMNIPGVAKGNWKYRIEKAQLTKDLAERLAQTTAAFSRSSK